MAQNTSYGIGQYTYDSTLNYMTLLGATTPTLKEIIFKYVFNINIPENASWLNTTLSSITAEDNDKGYTDETTIKDIIISESSGAVNFTYGLNTTLSTIKNDNDFNNDSTLLSITTKYTNLGDISGVEGGTTTLSKIKNDNDFNDNSTLLNIINKYMPSITIQNNEDIITGLDTTLLTIKEDFSTIYKIDYASHEVNNNKYRDIIIDLPDNIQSKHSYYVELTLPRNSQIDTVLNLKLCTQNSDNKSANFNNFQQIQQLNIPKYGVSNNESVYEDVVLFEYKNSGTTFIGADIPIKTTSSNNIYEKNRLYLINGEYKYCVDDENTLKTVENNNFSEYNLLATWKVRSWGSTDNSMMHFNFIFTPKYDFNDSYKYLWLEIVQDTDYIRYQDNGQNYNGKFLPLNNISATFYEINNLISYSTFGLAPIKSGTNNLNSISVNAPENFMLTINGEEIEIGPSNHYELSDYDINFLGLVIKNKGENNNFTIDYTYAVES